MTSSIPSSKSLEQSIAPYALPPIAASIAIVPVFRDMIVKSAQQKGMPIPSMPIRISLKEGIKAAPTVGTIVGVQMISQRILEKALLKESDSKNFSSTLISSAIVGTASAPILAIFNGQTMGWTIKQTLRKFSAKQGLAIAIQETAFVGGLSIADQLAAILNKKFGNSKAIDYTASFIAGAAGSLAGHPANTALTRWQSGLTINNPRQLMWGSMRKARAVGIFSMIYKAGKETLNSTFAQ